MNDTSPSISVETLLSHRAWVRALARSLVCDPATADDLSQEAMLAALCSPPRDETAVRAWFRRVLRNRLLNSVRSNSRRGAREAAVARSEAGPSLKESYERVERHRQIVDLVLRLPSPYRETVVLRYFEDLTPKEIGERMEMPASTVRSRLTRALAMLRERLDEKHRGNRREWCIALLPLLPDRPTAGTVGTTALVSGGAALMGTKLKIIIASLALVVMLAGLSTQFGGGGADEPPPAPDPEPAALGLAPPPPFGDAPLYRSGGPPPRPSVDATGRPWSDGLAADAQARALFDAAIGEVLPLLGEFSDIEAYLAGKSSPGVRLSLTDEARELLLRVAETGDPGERRNAVLALAAVAELCEEGVRFLEHRLDLELAAMRTPGDEYVVFGLAWTLTRHGSRRGIDVLADAVRTGRGAELKGCRRAATLLLALLDDPETAPLLRDLLVLDPDRLVRKHAAVGLGRLGGSESLRVLADALRAEEDTEVRAAAAYGLGRALGGSVDLALEEAFRREQNPLARVGAIAGLVGRSAEPKRFVQEEGLSLVVATAVGSEDAVERFFSTTTLRRLPASESRDAGLRRVAADDPVEWIRREALTAIVENEGAAAVAFLTERLAAEPSARLRREIRRGLRSLRRD